MNFKTTYILFGALVGLLALLLVTQKGAKETSNVGYVLPSLHEAKVQAKDIDVVEVDRKQPKAEKLVFTRAERGWRLEQPSVRAQAFAVDDLINQVMRASKEEREVDVTDNPELFGLADPKVIVTLKKGSEKQWQLMLGEESAGPKDKALVYVTSSDAPKEVLAVRRSQLDQLFKEVNDFRSKDLLAEGALNFPDVVQVVKLQTEKGSPVILQKNDKNRWRFDQPPYGDADEGGDPEPAAPGKDSRQSGMKGLLNDLSSLRVDTNTDFVADDVTDFAKYGLEAAKPAWLRIEIQRRLSNIAPEGEKAKVVDDALLIGNKTDDKGEKRYARLESEKSVVSLPVKKIENIVAIAENPSALRNRDLVEVDTWKTDAIDLQGPEGKIELRRTGTPDTWKLYQGAKKIAEADFGAVQDLIKALNAKRQVKDFIDKDKATGLGFDKPTAVVSVWIEGLKKDEKKDEAEKKDEKKDAAEAPQLKSDKPTIKLSFGKKEKDFVYVEREMDGDKSIVTVGDSLLTKVSHGQLAYLERILPSFSESAEIQKLAIRRGNDAFVLEKTKRDDKTEWTLKEPKDLAGRKADGKNIDRIIGELRRLRTDKLVAEKAADLDQYGLKQPQLQATVTIKKGDKETEDYLYQFGKETPDGLYAKQGQRNIIFMAKPADLDAALHSELQDPTVFQFTASQVESIKLTGWESLGIGTQTLELKNEPGTGWTAIQPANFNLDNQQVDSVVTDLSNLAADRFVVRGSGPQPSHRLDAKERIVGIEIRLKDDKSPLTLTIGALDAAAKEYFASSSTLPKDVFHLPQSRFEKLATQGIKFFSKTK